MAWMTATEDARAERQVNLNDEVWVKLTPDGIATYNADPVRKKIREEMPQYAREVQEVEDFQLWELMQIFGQNMYNGGPVLFQDLLVYFHNPDDPDV